MVICGSVFEIKREGHIDSSHIIWVIWVVVAGPFIIVNQLSVIAIVQLKNAIYNE